MKPTDNLTCVIPINVFLTAANLCSKRVYANWFSLNSLEMLIEALILYDNIIIYSYLPSKPINEIYLRVNETEFGRKLLNDEILSISNPYGSIIEREDENKLWWEKYSNFASIDFFEGNGTGTIFLPLPPDFLNFSDNILIQNPDIEAFYRGFEVAYSKKMLKCVNRDSLNDFAKPWTINRLWQIEMGNIVRQKEVAHCLLIPPDCTNIYVKEKELSFSNLHKKYNEFHKIMYDNKFKNEHIIDFSPLTIVALDTTISREYLIENIMQMREDYKELRDVGKDYQNQLESAENYLEIENIISSWVKSWDLVLKKISKTEKPLIRRLFGWDMFKSLSYKKIAGNILLEIGKELYDKTLVNKLSILYFLEKEFVSSRKVYRRIEHLFGGISVDGYKELDDINIATVSHNFI